MSLSYLHEKLSLAVYEMCTSTQTLKGRLRTSVRHSFTGFPEESVPEELRLELSEIKTALTGVKLRSLELDPIDHMKPSEVRRLLDRIISLHDAVTREYYKRTFQRGSSDAREKTVTSEDLARKVGQLVGRLPSEKKT